MATTSLQHEEHSKRDRILNALAVYPEQYQMSNTTVAELTGASASYVYQLRAAIDEGELGEDAIASARDDQLRSGYRDRLEDLLEESDVPRAAGGDDDWQSIVEDAMGSPVDDEPDGTVPVAAVQGVRKVMEQYREDAAFERERFEGPGKNIAEEKYLVANRTIELLDDILEG